MIFSSDLPLVGSFIAVFLITRFMCFSDYKTRFFLPRTSKATILVALSLVGTTCGTRGSRPSILLVDFRERQRKPREQEAPLAVWVLVRAERAGWGNC